MGRLILDHKVRAVLAGARQFGAHAYKVGRQVVVGSAGHH